MDMQTKHLPETLYSCKEGLKIAGKTLARGESFQWEENGIQLRKALQLIRHRRLTPQKPKQEEPKAEEKKKPKKKRQAKRKR